jgi:3-methyladenine DNA glycosylase AlkC
MATNKLSKLLHQYLEKEQPSTVEVIVELKNTPPVRNAAISKQEKIKFIKKSFSDELDNINKALEETDTKIIDTAWINKTIKMQIPVSSLEKLSGIKSVENIDLPQQLKKD